MSHCKANPCCADYSNCKVPVPQHKSGLTHFNDPEWRRKFETHVKALRGTGRNAMEAKTDWDHRTSKKVKSTFDLYPWEKAPDDWR